MEDNRIPIPKMYTVNTYYYQAKEANVIERYMVDDDGNEYFLDRQKVDKLPVVKLETK
jgi:hypothetical protein